MARVGLGVSALLALLGSYAALHDVADNLVQRPAWPVLPGLTPTRIDVTLLVLLLPALGLILGRPARISAAVVGVGLLGLFAWEQQTYSNHVALCALLCLWFAVSSPADPRLLMTQLSVCYAFAGLVKLNAEFLSGDVLRSFVSVPLPDQLWPVLAVVAVSVELGLAVGLWLPSIRMVAGLLGALFHLSVPLLMGADRFGLASFSLTCLCLYPLFLTRSPESGGWQRQPLEHGRVAAEPEL